MHQPRDHRIDNQRQQHEAEAEEEIAERLGDVLPAEPFVAHAEIIQLAGLDQPVIPAPAFVQHFRFRHATGEDDRVHREFLDAEMGVEKMD